MNIAKLEPALRSLLTATPEEVAEEGALGRIALELLDGEPRLTVIVTHDGLPDIPDVEILSSRGDLATVRLGLPALDALSERPEVVYINASRSGKAVLHRSRAQIGANVVDGRSIRGGTEQWNGTGVTVGIIDLGFDLRHPAFRQYPGGPTRVHLFWDRSPEATTLRPIDTAGPGGVGVLYDRATIDNFLLGPAANPPILHPNSTGVNQHGTHVGGIAAGSAAPHRGVAPGATLILVQTGVGDLGQLADISEWIFNNAIGPCSINISLGNNSGPHDGTSAAERGLDALLRDQATLVPTPRRFIAVAAGNEASKGWHVRAKVLGADRPITPILWESPFDNTGQDQIVFACSGHDRIRLRLLDPGGARTNFVTPDPANGNQSIDEAVAGGLAPTVAGAQPEKLFTFGGGTVARIAHTDDPISGDRHVEVHFRPPAGGAITEGVWQLEFQGATNDLPGGGILHGYLRDDVPDVRMDSSFHRPDLTSRTLVVRPGATLEQDIFVPDGSPAEATLLLDYPVDREVEIQIRPPVHLIAGGATASQFVRHGTPDPTAVADGALTAPGAATADHRLPFVFGAQTVEIGHGTEGSRRRITVRLLGAGPEAGLYRIRLRSPSGDRPVSMEARLLQQAPNRFEMIVLRDDPNETVEIEAFPSTCIESAVRLAAGSVPGRVDLRITIPGGANADVRMRLAPEDGGQETDGSRMTPWVSPGNAETAATGSLPVVGGTGARVYNDGTDARVSIDYPAAAAGADGQIEISVSNPTAGGFVRGGDWRLEFRSRDASKHRLRCTLVHVNDNVGDFGLARLHATEEDRLDVDVLRSGNGATSIPFSIDRISGDTIRVELIHPAATPLRVRVRPPDPDRMPFAVESGNRVVQDPGTPAPVTGADGVTATLSGGSNVVIDHPGTEVFGGHRRVLVTIQSPGGRTTFPPRGMWHLEVDALQRGPAMVTARMTTTGLPANFVTFAPPNEDLQQGSLSVPGSGREIMSVANCLPGVAPMTIPSTSSSPGPVRYATHMRLAGASRPWQPYVKPEVIAPGSAIAAAYSSFSRLWLNEETFLGWESISLPDGRSLSMRESWPLLEGDLRRVVHPVPPAPAAGALTETAWDVILPNGAFRARLIVRYPAGNPFAIRMEQPGAAAGLPAPPAPNRTHAVDPNGAEIAVAGGAPGTPTTPHADGRGRSYALGDTGQVTIRQNGAGVATVDLRGFIHPGRWRLVVQHSQVFPTPVQVAVESVPEDNALGWPQMGVVLNPRQQADMPRATGAATPGQVGFPIGIPADLVSDFVVDITYPPPVPAGAYSFELLVLAPGGVNTSAVDTNGVQRPITGGVATVAPAVPGGARYGIPHGPGGANHVVITHAPGRARVVISRGTSTDFSILDGEWEIRLLNRSTTTPAAPVPIQAEMAIGPHDAPFLRLPDGPVPIAYTRFGHLATGAAQEWGVRVPERRRIPLTFTIIYDSRDVLELQLEDPSGIRTEGVGAGNTPNPGANGATLANSSVAAGGVEFVSAGRFRAVIAHGPQPLSGGARNEIRIALHPEGDAPLPDGDWILHLRPGAIDGASNGVVEAWVDEMLFRTLSGTSMASPHVAGLAALLMQQDHTRTHADLKRLMISTARPLVITNGGAPQLPNQWDPTAGWGLVDGAAALLGHAGGPLHKRGAAPGAVGRTTSCPVACEDNCLLEGVHGNGTITHLVPARDAPYNRAPRTADGAALTACAGQAAYMESRTGTPFTGGGTFQTLASTRVDRPLVRDRDQRGGLDGFTVASWEDAYEAVIDRWVDQWTESGATLVLEPRLRAGLVRELLFNRFVHHLHRMLGASSTVTKCSFTIKKDVSVVTARVPFGAPGGGAAGNGLKELWDGTAPTLVGRCDLSLSRNVVLWGANPEGNAPGSWNALLSAQATRGPDQQFLVVDPGLQGLPSFARRISILPGSDRELALAILLRIVGNPGHADAARQIPEDPRFADAGRGLQPLLTSLGTNVADFVTHVRTEAASHLRIDGGRVVPDVVAERCLGTGASAAALARFGSDFDALYEAYMSGPTATILGDGAARHLDGEENVQYIAALCFLSGNVGRAGGGIAVAEDRDGAFNPPTFASPHDTTRPEQSGTFGSEAERELVNLASVAADAPETTRIALWFDLDPLTALPDSSAIEGLLQRTQFNVQITGMLNDSSRFADIILPLGDTLRSYDLQTGARSPWINLTQPIESLEGDGPRPFARVLHELFAALHARLLRRFEDDLKPVIVEDQMKRGPLLLSPTRRQELGLLFTDANRIPDLLRDRLPGDEVTNIHTQLREWYAGIHGGEPTTDTDAEVVATDPIRFFNRMQVDWILEVLLARYPEREAILVLYQLLQRGTALDPARFEGNGLSTHPDGDTAFASNIAHGTAFADLKGTSGFAPERPAYRDAVRAMENGTSGRAAYPMRLVIAESPAYSSASIPLSAQVDEGRIQLPVITLNPDSPSLSGRFGGPLAEGAAVSIVGNVSYTAGERFETVITRALVHPDPSMAVETVWMRPGWQSLGRGGQKVARGVHTEEGESPAIFDNLVRIDEANYAPAANAETRGSPPPKRAEGA